MVAAANGNATQEMDWSWYFAGSIRLFLRELEQAEALAGRALELSEQNQFPQIAAFSRCTVGLAQALLGRATEGIGLIQQGIAGLQAVGGRVRGASYLTALAAAQLFTGAVVEALATAEQALDDPMARPGALTFA